MYQHQGSITFTSPFGQSMTFAQSESDCDLEFLKKSEMEKKMNLMGGIIEMGHP